MIHFPRIRFFALLCFAVLYFTSAERIQRKPCLDPGNRVLHALGLALALRFEKWMRENGALPGIVACAVVSGRWVRRRCWGRKGEGLEGRGAVRILVLVFVFVLWGGGRVDGIGGVACRRECV
ncbi:hypothetical protein BDR22DRAFT_852677, partial [Usnea florida]